VAGGGATGGKDSHVLDELDHMVTRYRNKSCNNQQFCLGRDYIVEVSVFVDANTCLLPIRYRIRMLAC